MSMPKHIMILGKRVKIKVEASEDNHGQFNHDDLEIKIDSSLHSSRVGAALLHECVHAILAIGGASYNMSEGEEEALVRLLESGLEDIVDFKFNIAP